MPNEKEGVTPIKRGELLREFKELEAKFGTGLALSVKTEDNTGMKPYSEWKHDLLQIIATALAIAAITVPLLQWGIDSKVQGMESKLDAVNVKIDARFDQLSNQIKSMEAGLKDHQAMYERVIDERTGKR